ncbi:MAG: DUF123 domain-containing protein [Nanohaloarchaea archaeon SW_7_46_7]|nr:MAG: DUF123 domain-containing protein [Nanohaloarchaea archaeon SW_7_46_7]
MKKGSYILLIELEEKETVKIGPGNRELEKGFYTYFGTAFGPGGLKRVERHSKQATGEKNVKHWHIDYLTTLEKSRMIKAVKFPEKDLECELASQAENTVEAFGSTDCECGSHLAYFHGKEEAEAFLKKMKAEYLDS